jgi:hypothetical protein
MREIYQVTIHGRKLESRDLRQLLARAVLEKRTLDARLRVSARWGRCDSEEWDCVGCMPASLALSPWQ